MEPRLTDREFEILVKACYWYKRYQDSHPDVGLGPSDLTLVRNVCNSLSFYVSPHDVEVIAHGLGCL